MRLVILNDTLVGKKTANNIYNENGIMFLREGSTLTLNIIKRLINMGIGTLYIEEDVANMLTLQEVLDSKIKLKLIKRLMELFKNIKKTQYIEYEAFTSIVEEIIKNINLSENAILLNNFTKNDNMFNFCMHAIDVTLIAIKVGSYRRYDIKKLTNLALAAILHDVGKLITDDDEVQHHAVAGYNLLRKNIMFKSTTYMSVLNHHEFEDGSGPLHEKEKIYMSLQK